MTDSLPPIYYINLANRPERRDFMERQFARLGLVAQRIEAATVADVPADAISWGGHPHNPWPMMPGELPVNYSHRKFWQALVASGALSAVILEDDAVMDDTLPAIL